MATPICPTCCDKNPETLGQDALSPDTRRTLSPAVIAAALVLVIGGIAFLGQTIILHPVTVPVAANASTSLFPPPTPGVPGTQAILTMSSPLQPYRTTPSQSADSERPAAPPANPGASPASSTGYSREIPVITASSLETRIHGLVNRVRQEHGLPALGTDTSLTYLARAHSSDMAARGYFGHVNLDERDATARGAAVGYTCHKDVDPSFTYAIAENLYATYRYTAVLLDDNRPDGYAWTTEETMAEEAVDAWMNSPDHRDNILDPGMGREGIGVAFGQGDMVFVTQEFC